MANIDSASGCKPVGHMLGIPWNQKVRWYYAPVTESSVIGMYDVVIATADGADSTGRFPLCAQHTASSVYKVGVAVAFQTNTPSAVVTSLAASATDTRIPYKPTLTACYVGVIDDPYIIMEVQEDSAGGGQLVAADAGLNCDLVVGSVNTTTGLSAMELDSSSKHATNELDCRLLCLAGTNTDRNNTVGSANSKWYVMFNTHFFKGTVGL